MLELTLIPLAWAGAVLGALSLQHLQILNQQSVCGAWGCGPPVSALVAIHAGWAVAIWPPLLYIPLRLRVPDRLTKRLSRSAILIGAGGIATIVLYQLVYWLPAQSAFVRSFGLQRCGFAVVTACDWPVLQMLTGGILLSIASRSGLANREASGSAPDTIARVETTSTLIK